MASTWLMATWAGGGNVNPFLGLAEQLKGRGHRVGAVAGVAAASRLSAAGIEVVALSDAWLPGADALKLGIDALRPDALVVDYMLTDALCGAEQSGLPTVALVHTLFSALLVDGSPHPITMAGSVDMLNDVRRRLEMPSIRSHAELLAGADLVLVAAPRQLDAPTDQLPANVEYSGPLFEGPGPDASWAPPDGDGPLVVVSVGTAGDPGTQTELLERIMAALAELRVRGLVSVPDYIEHNSWTPPRNVTLARYVRHSAVLSSADLLVTHAGLGSVTAALAFGVPMVCLPLDREQPQNAQAVARLGAGSALPPNASVAQIQAAIQEQLHSPRHVSLPAQPGLAAELVERVLSSRT
jgi:UDP:flavonoid glycosyltransferase YjiC (YdhE family)